MSWTELMKTGNKIPETWIHNKTFSTTPVEIQNFYRFSPIENTYFSIKNSSNSVLIKIAENYSHFSKSKLNYLKQRTTLGELLGGKIYPSLWPIYFPTKEEVIFFLEECDKLGFVG